MAIINCPSCNQKISDKAKVCSICLYDFISRSTAQGLNEEQLASQKKMAYIKQKYSLQMQAMVSIILVLGGSLLWYFGNRGTSSMSDIVSLGLLAIGSGLYLATRIRLIMFKKRKSQ